MLKFIIFLLLIYLFFKLGKILLTWYIREKLGKPRRGVKPVNDKFKDADDAKFTDIIDPDKKNNNE